MKRLVGGEYLLDLTPIEIEQSEDVETFTNIINKDVIEQLTDLKKYISNPNGIKPVWVKLKNGVTDELIVARGEFKVVDTGEFEIVIHLDGYKLLVHIEFTQVTLEDDTPIDDWYIAENDVKYLFTSELQNIDTITSSGDLSSVKANEIIENMNGYSFNLASPTGYTLEGVYVGACKNGNKLTFVLAFNITRNEDNLTGNVSLGEFIIPENVGVNLIPARVGEYNYLLNLIATGWTSAWSNRSQIFALAKADNSHINAYFDSSANTNLIKDAKYYFRVEMTFLLGDNLIPESQGE